MRTQQNAWGWGVAVFPRFLATFYTHSLSNLIIAATFELSSFGPVSIFVVWLVGRIVFYAAFNNILVISRRQFTLFMSFLGFTSTRLGLWSVLPKDTPTKKPRGSSAARTQDPWITSQTLYHWPTQDPLSSGTEVNKFADATVEIRIC